MPIKFVCGECGLWEPFEGTCALDGHPLEPTDDPLVGTDLGAYRLVRVLGQGGMGRVYAAVHPSSGSRVAIKLIAEKFATQRELLDRFFAEARAVNLIRHENIVNIVDLVVLPDGRPFIVMELITGQTLRQLAAAKSPIGGIVHVMIEVLAALAAAHAIGIVHRDLKPDNILVTSSGHAKVLDFGIAKLSQALPGAPALRTQTGVVLGTPEYMAPEMVVGDAVDGRADLYAIGLILYELLAGKRPYTGGSDFEVMKAHLEQTPAPLRTVRPELPESLERAVATALAKRPQERFENATAMQKALRRIAIELGDDQRKPMLGEWLAPAAFTDSLVVAKRPTQAATVRAKPVAKPKPTSKRVIIPIVVGAAACFGIAAVIAMNQSEPERRVVEPAKPSSPRVVEPAPEPVTTPPEPEPPEPVPVPIEVKTPVAKTKAPAREAAPPLLVTFDPTKTKYDAKRFDWRAFLSAAEEHARGFAPDAMLVAIELEPIAADGTIDLTRGGPSRYVFRSAIRTQRRDGCTITITVGASIGAKMENLGCMAPFAPDPPCGIEQVLATPQLKGSPPTRLTYNAQGWNAETVRDPIRCP